MTRIQNSFLRLSIVLVLSAGGITMHSVASAACPDPNTCFGTGTMPSNENGSQNTAVGYEALFRLIGESAGPGWNNTAVGYHALHDATQGSGNTAVGYRSLFGTTTGSSNTAIGYESLLRNLTGQNNTALGVHALGRNDFGSYNTAVGASSLTNNQLGSSNTAVGTSALGSTHDGSENTAVGQSALRNITDSNRNTATGFNALGNLTAGTNNTAIGFQALLGRDVIDGLGSTGNNNTASGANSLRRNTLGDGNTGIGADALRANSTGDRNTGVGSSALRSVTTGVRNVAIGAGAGTNITTSSDNIVIGGDNQGTATDVGVIRIGRSANQKKTFIAAIRGVKTGLTGATAVVIDANGQLGTVNSSREVKEDIVPMGDVSGRLLSLRPVTFRYKEVDIDGRKPIQYGLIAEEVAETFPELVVYDANGKPETVSYHLLATLLLNEFQKERVVTQAQATRIADLEQQFTRMAEIVDRLNHTSMVATAH